MIQPNLATLRQQVPPPQEVPSPTSQPNTVGLPVPPQPPPTYGAPPPCRVYEELWCDGKRYKLVLGWHRTSLTVPMSIGPEYELADFPEDPDLYMPHAEFLYNTGMVTLQIMHRFPNGKEEIIAKYGKALEELAVATKKLDDLRVAVTDGCQKAREILDREY